MSNKHAKLPRGWKGQAAVFVPCENPAAIADLIVDRWQYSNMPTVPMPLTDSNRAPMAKLRKGYELARADGDEIIGYIHSDVEIYEDKWLDRTLNEFNDSKVGVVGWGGALKLGHEDIYKVPYELLQLARYDYRSNVEDAEAHGARELGSIDVATLDGFCLFVRRQVLDELGGWPEVNELPFHNYDNWLCAKAWEYGWKVRMCGVFCKHLGGGTSVKVEDDKESWTDWAKRVLGKSDQEIHEESHRWLYEKLRGVLPISVVGRTGRKEGDE